MDGLDAETATAPIDIMPPALSKMGVKETPSLTLLKMPPLVVPTNRVSGEPGTLEMARSAMRPPVAAGPMLRHSRPVSAGWAAAVAAQQRASVRWERGFIKKQGYRKSLERNMHWSELNVRFSLWIQYQSKFAMGHRGTLLPKVCLGWLAAAAVAPSQIYNISTFAGGAPIATPSSALRQAIEPSSIVTDAAGSFYFTSDNSVYRVDSTGTLTRVAGNGRAGYSGDGSPALRAQLNHPSGLAFDSAGNLLIGDPVEISASDWFSRMGIITDDCRQAALAAIPAMKGRR